MMLLRVKLLIVLLQTRRFLGMLYLSAKLLIVLLQLRYLFSLLMLQRLDMGVQPIIVLALL